MIIVEEVIIPDIETLDSFLQHIQDSIYKEEHKIYYEIYYSFLMECYEADKRLQGMVSDKMRDDLISLVFLPLKETRKLDEFYFELFSEEDKKIKKREELMYQDFCKICFGGIKPYYNRLIDYYNEQS